jgi:PAS domain S-box-containing protein
MVDQSSLMIWRAGLDKGCDYFNGQWYAFTGRSPAQEYGDGWAEGVHRDDFLHCLSVYVECFDARRSFEMYYRLRRHDGAFRWIFDRGAPIADEKGEFAGYFGTCVDVTEQVAAEPALEARCLRSSLGSDEYIPVCAWCKRVRGDEGRWNQIHRFIEGKRKDLSHTICPECQSVLISGAVSNFPPRQDSHAGQSRH